MILKKFYGDTTKEAREKAFSKLGEDCIVLETTDATTDHDASVTVMLDKKKEELIDHTPTKEKTIDTGSTYNRKDLMPNSLKNVKEAVKEGFNKLSSGEEPTDNTSQISANVSQRIKAEKTDDALTMSRRSTPVYKRNQNGNGKSSGFQQQIESQLKEAPVSKEVKALHRRFDHMEKVLSDVLISANLEYVSHPAFQQLLNTGIEATTVMRWFQRVLNKGIHPYEQSQSFMFELADIVRSALSFAVPEAASKNMLFVGPSGAGKTSLIMKLAMHPDFMLDKSIALVSVQPKGNRRHYTPLSMFSDDEELPFYTVRDGVEMSTLLPDLEAFDHVLFDTPSISLQQQAAFRDFWQIRQMLSSVTPLEIHYTVNATLERYYFRESYAADHPLQPDYVAITHLDETDKWGHLIPFINEVGASVRYVSQGAGVPDNLHTFKAEWFAEKILSKS